MPDESYDPKPQRVACFNKSCGETLFISGLLGPDTTLRGIDRQTIDGRDERGPYIVCPRCGAKHIVIETRVPGSGIQCKIAGLRAESKTWDASVTQKASNTL